MGASFNLIDNIMVGQLGDVPVASVGLANQFFMILFLVMQGVGGSTAVFVSQFSGKKDYKSIKHSLGMGLIFSISASSLFLLAASLFPQFIMKLFSTDPLVIESGSLFLGISCLSYIPLTVTFCFGSALRGIHEVLIPMQANMLGIAVNTSLNFILIFGRFGFPAMGVKGAAIATVTASSITLIFLLLRIYAKMPDLLKGLKDFLSISGTLFRRFTTQTLTMIGKDLIWVVGISVYMGIYARLGTDVAASMNITNIVRQLTQVIFIGIANACQVMVGNSLGMNDKKKAAANAGKFLFITLGLAIFIGILLIVLKNIILLPYKVSETVTLGAENVLLVYGIALIFYMYNMVAVVGIMRSGGDNLFCAFMDTVAVWFIGLPLALLSGFILKFRIEWVFALISVQEIFKAVLLTLRFRSGRWIHNLVHDI